MSEEKTYLMEWSAGAHGTYKVKANNIHEAYDKLYDDMQILNDTGKLNSNSNLVVTFLEPDDLHHNDLEECPIKIITNDGKEIDIRDIEEEMI